MTKEQEKFSNTMEAFIKEGKALTETQIDELTILYSDYLNAEPGMLILPQTINAFKLGLIFATKIQLGK